MCWEECASVITQAELCKNGSVETFAWYCVSGLSLLVHGLNTHTLRAVLKCARMWARTMRLCAEDLLITLSEGEALRHKEGRPAGLSHTQDFPSCCTSTIFSFYLRLFFSHRGQRCTGGKLKGESLSQGKKYIFFFFLVQT